MEVVNKLFKNRRIAEPSATKEEEALPLTEQKGWSSNLSPYAIYQGLGGQVYAMRNLSVREIINNFESIPPLATGIYRMANAVSSLPIALIDKRNNQPVESHPLLDLLQSPNKENQKILRAFMRDMTIWKLLSGDVYLVMTGRAKAPPLEMFLLHPEHITTEANGTGLVQNYRYTQNNAQGLQFSRDPRTDLFYDAARTQQLVHMVGFSADYGEGNNEFKGQSEAKSLYYEVNQYVHASQHNLSLIQNGLRPSGAFVLKTRDGQPASLTDAAFERIKEQINEQYSGGANTGRPLVLEGGLEWAEMSITPKDLDFPQMRQSAKEQIYENLGIPVQLVSSTKVTAGNMVNIRKEFVQHRVIPFCEEQLDYLNLFLLPRYPDLENFELRVNKDEIDVLFEDRLNRRTIVEKSLVMTINEKRAYFNMEPIEGGDKIIDPNGRPIAGEGADAFVQFSGAGAAPPPEEDTEEDESGKPPIDTEEEEVPDAEQNDTWLILSNGFDTL